MSMSTYQLDFKMKPTFLYPRRQSHGILFNFSTNLAANKLISLLIYTMIICLYSVTANASDLGASSIPVDFGTVVLGQNRAQAVQLTNLGNLGDPDIEISSVGLSGVDAAEFSHDFVGPITLSAGNSTTVNVTLTPVSVGAKTASLDVTHTGDNSPLAVGLTGTGASQSGVVLYRVNTGGWEITTNPNWEADSGSSPSPYVNTGNAFATGSTIDVTDPSLPSGIPEALFRSERWDSGSGPELQWDFPVTPGSYEVRLFFADIFSGTNAVGARVFDVSIEGVLVLDDYDIFVDVGGFTGVMKTFFVAADGNLDIDFAHVVENPKISAIEILGASNEQPLITSAPVTTATENQVYSYDVEATDPDPGDTLTFSLETAPAGATIDASSGLISWTPSAVQVGVNNFTVRVTDDGAGALFDEQSFSVTVSDINQPPTITSSPVITAAVGQTYSYDVEATDPDPGDTLTFSLEVAPLGASINSASGLISWTPTAAQLGANAFIVRVTDDGAGPLSVDQNFTVTVTGNQPPTITSTPVTTATENQLYSYDVEATDPDPGDTLTFSLEVAPAGATIDASSGLISWTPSAAQTGAIDFTVRVTDDGAGALFAEQSFTVTVTDINQPPTITSTPVTTATENQPYSYDVEATDPDPGDTLTFSLEVAPAGAIIDASSGLISWTPTAAQVGSNNVTVRATDDGVGTLFAEQNFTVTVSENSACGWETASSLTVALGEVAGGIIDNKMYMVGEGDPGTLMYDLLTDTWSSPVLLSTRPLNGHHHAAEVINGKLYLIGGLGHGSDGQIQIYDPVLDSWTTGAAAPFAAGSSASAVIGGQIYFAGGIIGLITTDQVAVYDPAADSWSSLTAMPEGVNHAASATDGNKLYVFGGRDGPNSVSNGFNYVQIYDPVTDSWESSTDIGSLLSPLPQARGGMGKAVFYNGEFYVIGGETQNGAGATAANVYDRVDIYNPQTNTWRAGPTMPAARHGIFPLESGGRIYVAGGGIQAGDSQSTVFEVYTACTNDLGATPDPVGFGAVIVGQSSALGVQLTHLGTVGDPDIDISAVGVSGVDAAEFSHDFVGPITLSAGNSTTVNVTLTPGSVGTKTASLDVTHTGNNSPLAVGLTGTGTLLSDLGAASDPVGFGAVIVGQSSAQAVQLTHLGAVGDPDIDISAVGLSGVDAAEFSHDFVGPITLSAGNSTTVNVTLTPGSVGTKTASLDVTHTGNNSPLAVGLTGTGTLLSDLGAAPDPVGFGAVIVGQSSAQAVQLTHLGAVGDSDIDISAVGLSGVDAAEFSHDFVGPITLSAGNSTTVNVTLTPGSVGTKTASLDVTHTGNNSPLAVGLTGTGTSQSGVVLYRINAGGAGLTATPNWEADTSGNPSPYVNTGNIFQTGSTIDVTDPSLPSGIPEALFRSERWDSGSGPELQWDFPVTPGSYEVRLFFADIFSGTNAVGARVFDVSIEGVLVLDDYDIFADVGGFTGVMKTFLVTTADSNLDIDFAHVVENPKISAIEILGASNEQPLITSAPVTTATENQVYSYDVEATDPDPDDTLTFSLEVAPAGATIDASSGLISWTPSAVQVGVNNFTVRVTDDGAGALFDEQTFTVTVTDINQPPSITSSPITTAAVGHPYSYDVEATDPDPGDTLTFSLDVAPQGASINSASGLISWTPTAAQLGSNAFIVRVTDDGAGTLFADQNFTVTVTDNQPPTITSTPVTTAIENQPYSYDVEATDPNPGDTLTFSLEMAPAGATIDASSGLISWTPSAAQTGAIDFTVRVTDDGAGALFAEQSFTVTVTDINQPPTITSTPVTIATENQAYTYDVEATDPDPGDTLTFSLVVAPTGATIDASSGLISWTPTAAQVGSNNVTVRATDDGVGTLFAEQNFTVTVSENSACGWETASSLPVALGEVAGGIIDNKMYMVGEGDPGTLMYDLLTDTWSSPVLLSTRPFDGHHHTAEVINGKLYLIGGLGHGSDGQIQIYDPVLDSWTTGAAAPFAAGSSASAVIGGQIYFAGGIIGLITTDQVAVYDPAADSWSSLTAMPEGVNHAASATDGNKLYVFGGRDGPNSVSNGFNYVQIYDPVTDSWESSTDIGSLLSPLPQARGGMGKAVFYNGEFYVIGGETQNGAGATAANVYDRVDIYNPQTNTWRAGPTMPTARHGIFPLESGGRIYVAGGGIQAGDSQSTVFEVYTACTNDLGATPDPVEVGVVLLGQNSVVAVQLTHLGNVADPDVDISSVVLSGVDASEFSHDFIGPVTLSGGNSTTVNVTFAPSSVGAKTASLDVTHTGNNSPLTVGVTGTGSDSSGAGVHFRVNAGGAVLSASPNWEADTSGSPSQYVNTGNTSSTGSPINLSDPSLPLDIPQALFQSERWDPSGAPEMQWDFPVPPGNYEVRLFFADIFSGTQAVGARVFDVLIEGAVALDDYDIFADVGGYTGVMKSFIVNSDGNLDIDFAHVIENPAIKGIEIFASSNPGILNASPTMVDFGAVLLGQSDVIVVQLTNFGGSGDPDIIVQSIALTGVDATEFSDDFIGPVTLAPGESILVNVTFLPQTSGGKIASLEVTHDGNNSPLIVGLTGTGTSSFPIGFGKSTLPGTGLSKPTSLQFGPDDRLYVAQQNGVIKVYTVSRVSANNYQVDAVETITAIQSMANHDDDGTLNLGEGDRLVTGLLAAGTSNNPTIYVNSSDPRIGGGLSGADLNLDTNSTILSRLTWNGASWDKLDLVRGLPRSEENHHANGLALDSINNLLYIAMGGNTNAGAPSNNFALLPEFALSAAILEVDLDAIGETTLDLMTLDDEDRPGAVDANDPFGGNNGKNQAILDPLGPVQVYAPGFRNPYDVVITASGRMYSIDNGANGGWGDIPVGEGPLDICTNEINEPGSTYPDSLHYVSAPGYYGGHPNPTRGNINNTFNADMQSPVSASNPIECDFLQPGVENGAITTFGSSTNGLTEYTALNFGGAMMGNLLTASFDNKIYRIVLDTSGANLVSNQALFSSVGVVPLDVVAQSETDNFPGTIWVADHVTNQIIVYEPDDFDGGGSTCTGASDPLLDEDGDGYDNEDEIDNGTSPCSAGDTPPDFDGDFTSNLNDPDDDNDGLLDTTDPFAIDPDNGVTTNLPVVYTWENDAPNPGGLLNLGFTGLMSNGISDYETLFDPENMTAGGAAGVATIDAIPMGDAIDTSNNQEYGFQLGINVDANSPTFTARTRILAPFSGFVPEDFQSMGLFIGTGDQDNYVKLVLNSNGGVGGVEVLDEIGGISGPATHDNLSLPGPDYVDLYLEVQPSTLLVQASYEVTIAGTTGTRINLGSPLSIPVSWLNATTRLAVGLISTSRGAASTFTGTWDFIDVNSSQAAAQSQAFFSIAPEPDINASTTTSGSFQISNTSLGNQDITRISIDLSTAVLPEMVFDPEGLAGDTAGKDFTPDSGAHRVGLQNHKFFKSRNNGFNSLEIDFNDFGAGELFTFSVDVAPTNIRGPSNSPKHDPQNVSGLELLGSTIVAEFDDGSKHKAGLFISPGSVSASENKIGGIPEIKPSIEVLGISSFPTVVSDSNQVVRIRGPEFAEVTLVILEAGGFNRGQGLGQGSFKANSIISVAEHHATIGGEGFIDLSVTLLRSDPKGGINYMAAAAKETGANAFSESSSVIVLKLLR